MYMIYDFLMMKLGATKKYYNKFNGSLTEMLLRAHDAGQHSRLQYNQQRHRRLAVTAVAIQQHTLPHICQSKEHSIKLHMEV